MKNQNFKDLEEYNLVEIKGGADAKCVLGVAASTYLASGLYPAFMIASGIVAAAGFC